MNRRMLLATTLASFFTARAASARRSGDRGSRDRGTRTPRGPRSPRAPRGGDRVTVLGVWAIGAILLLDGSGEECEVIGHDGRGNSICLILD